MQSKHGQNCGCRCCDWLYCVVYYKYESHCLCISPKSSCHDFGLPVALVASTLTLMFNKVVAPSFSCSRCSSARSWYTPRSMNTDVILIKGFCHPHPHSSYYWDQCHCFCSFLCHLTCSCLFCITALACFLWLLAFPQLLDFRRDLCKGLYKEPMPKVSIAAAAAAPAAV